MWKKIYHYEDYYEISDVGEVRRLDTGKILKPCYDSDGYVLVALCCAGKARTKKIYRLVLEAFVGPCPEGMECRHLNGIRTDNRLKNLCWGTHTENNIDRLEHGTTCRGLSHPDAKFFAQQVRTIRQLHKFGGLKAYSISKAYKVAESCIRRIVSCKGYADVEN